MSEKHVFTFGSNHVDSEGRALINCYVVIDKDFSHSRLAMVKARGFKWSFQYTQEEFQGQAEKYCMTETLLNEVWLPNDMR